MKSMDADSGYISRVYGDLRAVAFLRGARVRQDKGIVTFENYTPEEEKILREGVPPLHHFQMMTASTDVLETVRDNSGFPYELDTVTAVLYYPEGVMHDSVSAEDVVELFEAFSLLEYHFHSLQYGMSAYYGITYGLVNNLFNREQFNTWAKSLRKCEQDYREHANTIRAICGYTYTDIKLGEVTYTGLLRGQRLVGMGLLPKCELQPMMRISEFKRKHGLTRPR